MDLGFLRTEVGSFDIMRKNRAAAPKWREIGWEGEIISPSASVDIRGRQRFSRTEDGRCGIVRCEVEIP